MSARHPVELTCSAREGSSGTVVNVSGELDLATTPQLEGFVLQLIDEGARLLILDVTHVPFMDSTAVGMLVRMYRRLGEVGGRMCLANVSSQVGMLLALMSIDRLLDVFDTVAAAEGAWGQR